jgi:hypothetical protein
MTMNPANPSKGGIIPPDLQAEIDALNIPPEVHARIQALAFFDALFEGDYDRAARAQEAIQKYGYFVGRAPEKRPARKSPRRQPQEVTQ